MLPLVVVVVLMVLLLLRLLPPPPPPEHSTAADVPPPAAAPLAVLRMVAKLQYRRLSQVAGATAPGSRSQAWTDEAAATEHEVAEALRLQLLAALRQLLHGALLPTGRARAAVWQLTPQLGAPAAAARAEAAMALDALCECAMRCRPCPPSPHRTARCRLYHHHRHDHGHAHPHPRPRPRPLLAPRSPPPPPPRHVSRWHESSALDVCEAGGTTQLADAMAEVYHAQQTQERCRLRHPRAPRDPTSRR